MENTRNHLGKSYRSCYKKRGGAALGTVLLALLALSGCRQMPKVPEQRVIVSAGDTLHLQKESGFPEEDELSEQKELIEQEELPKQEKFPALAEEEQEKRENIVTIDGKDIEHRLPQEPASIEETTVRYVCAMEESGIRLGDTIVLTARGDRVISMHDTVEVDLSAFDDEINEMFCEMFSDIHQEFQGIEGVICQAAIEGKLYILDVFVEVREDTLEELEEKGLLVTDGDKGYVSLSESEEILLQDGYEKHDLAFSDDHAKLDVTIVRDGDIETDTITLPGK